MRSEGRPAEQPARFRVGDIPPPAEGFALRPDTADDLLEALVPGAVIALVPEPDGKGEGNWLSAAGKTQMAIRLTEVLWRLGTVDVVVWISASSRAAILAGYAEAWTAATGIEPAGPGRVGRGPPG